MHHSQSKYVLITFMQDEEAEEVLAMADKYGRDAAAQYLTDWDFGQETEDAAVVNDDIYGELPSPRYPGFATTHAGGYTLVTDDHYSWVALYRELPADWQPTI